MQRLGDGGSNPRLFVDLQSDTVTGRMNELIPQPGSHDHVATGLVDVARGDTRPHGSQTDELRLANHIVHVPQRLVDLADEIGARHVGVIAIDQRSDVDDDEVTFFNHGRCRTVVRTGAVRPGRNNRVVARAIGTETTHPILEFVAYIPLGHPLREHRYALSERGIGAGRRATHSSDLGRRLASAQLRHDAADHDEMSRSLIAQRLVLGVSDLRRIDCNVLRRSQRLFHRRPQCSRARTHDDPRTGT